MPTLDQNIQAAVVLACEKCFQATIEASTVQVQQTRKEFEGDRTVVVFPLTRASQKSPEATAEDLGKYLVETHDLISAYQVVKGFLNLTVVPAHWTAELRQVGRKIEAPVGVVGVVAAHVSMEPSAWKVSYIGKGEVVQKPSVSKSLCR